MKASVLLLHSYTFISSDIKWLCLRKVVTEGKEEDTVTLESFAKMLHWFGPLKETGILERVRSYEHNKYDAYMSTHKDFIT